MKKDDDENEEIHVIPVPGLIVERKLINRMSACCFCVWRWGSLRTRTGPEDTEEDRR